MLALGCAFLEVLLQSTVLLMAGLLAVRAVPQGDPAWRVLVARVTLVGVLAVVAMRLAGVGYAPMACFLTLPELTSAADASASSLQSRRTGYGPPLPQVLAPARPHADDSIARASGPDVGKPAPLLPGNASAPRRVARLLVAIAVALWLSVACLLLFRLVYGCLLAARMRRSSRCASPELYGTWSELCTKFGVRQPALLVSGSVGTPCATGLWRSAILLPPTFERQLALALRRAILAHELAHIVHRDLWWRLLERALCILVWPQPLLWLLCAGLEQSVEQRCDEAALATGCSRREYARCLLDLADRLRRCHARRAFSAGAAAYRSPLASRVQRIIEQPMVGRPSLHMRQRLGCATVIGFLACAGHALLAIPVPANSYEQGAAYGGRAGQASANAARPRGRDSGPPGIGIASKKEPAALAPSGARLVQYLLNAHGYAVPVDGDYGIQTRSAVQRFQLKRDLPVSGSPTSATWAALAVPLQQGSRGPAVQAVQAGLNACRPDPIRRQAHVLVDGYYGLQTARAVMRFQRQQDLPVTGAMRSETWRSLVRCLMHAGNDGSER